jgi:hypothetical protein
VRLVVGHEVTMGDANGDYEVNGGGALESRDDLIAEGVLADMRVSDHEKSLLSVDGDGGSMSA